MRGTVTPEHEAVIRLVQDMIETALLGRLCEVATITRVGDGLVTVQFDDEDDSRTVGFPRVYGVQYLIGDRVGVMATSTGEWVCVGPVGAAIGNKSRRVTATEIGIAAITAEGKHLAAAAVETAAIADGAVTSAKLQAATNANTGAVTTGVIRDKAVTAEKLAQAYVTPGTLSGVLDGTLRPSGEAAPGNTPDPYQRASQVKATANAAKKDATDAAATYTEGRLAGTLGSDGKPNDSPRAVLRKGDVPQVVAYDGSNVILKWLGAGSKGGLVANATTPANHFAYRVVFALQCLNNNLAGSKGACQSQLDDLFTKKP